MITVKTFGNYKRQNFEPELMTGCDHDQNVYHYRLVNGQMIFRAVRLGHGWESRPMRWQTLSCYKRKEDEQMAKRQAPPYEELRQVFIDAEYKIDRVRKELKISWMDAKQWLKDAGLIDNYSRPTDKVTTSRSQALLESDDYGKPVRSMGVVEAESHNHHINAVAPIGVEVPQYEPSDNDFVESDDVPIPYLVEKIFDPAAFKLEVIENIIEMSGLRHAPKDMTLELISGIIWS